MDGKKDNEEITIVNDSAVADKILENHTKTYPVVKRPFQGSLTKGELTDFADIFNKFIEVLEIVRDAIRERANQKEK